MNRLITAICAATALMTAAGAASADTFKAGFKYDKAISAGDNYRQFQVTAAKACAVDRQNAGGALMRRESERACEAKVMADVVAALNNAELTGVHTGVTGAKPQLAVLAPAQ
jgi:putative intracellular protease/amidase